MFQSNVLASRREKLRAFLNFKGGISKFRTTDIEIHLDKLHSEWVHSESKRTIQYSERHSVISTKFTYEFLLSNKVSSISHHKNQSP